MHSTNLSKVGLTWIVRIPLRTSEFSLDPVIRLFTEESACS
jgi:hypothetical protein